MFLFSPLFYFSTLNCITRNRFSLLCKVLLKSFLQALYTTVRFISMAVLIINFFFCNILAKASPKISVSSSRFKIFLVISVSVLVGSWDDGPRICCVFCGRGAECIYSAFGFSVCSGCCPTSEEPLSLLGTEFDLRPLVNVTIRIMLITLTRPAAFQSRWLLGLCAFHPDQPSQLSNRFPGVTTIQKRDFCPSQLSSGPKPWTFLDCFCLYL